MLVQLCNNQCTTPLTPEADLGDCQKAPFASASLAATRKIDILELCAGGQFERF
jgi:hypothetical protein